MPVSGGHLKHLVMQCYNILCNKNDVINISDVMANNRAFPRKRENFRNANYVSVRIYILIIIKTITSCLGCVTIVIMLVCTVLHCTTLYCTVLYCTVLHCTVLYCIQGFVQYFCWGWVGKELMVKVVVAYVSTPTHVLACVPSRGGLGIFRSPIASVRMILVQE